MRLELDRDGAQLFPRVLDREGLEELHRLLPESTRPGQRLYGRGELARWLLLGSVRGIAEGFLGPALRPVRAILFDKSEATNWALGWHQDRTIPVRDRIDVPGFNSWNRKAGAYHVQPPFGLIERMITARIHLDPVPEDNAPLLIAMGSHRRGRIEEAQIERVREQSDVFSCLAEPGDVWLYRTAILHASARSTAGGRRRVLQVDFSADELPGGLEWLGIE